MESGRLEDESAASLCRRLGAESRTGCLHLTTSDVEGPGGGPAEAHLWLRDGRIHTAAAHGGRTTLGQRLVESGDLTAEQLEQALAAQLQRAPSPRLGDLLVQVGLVSRQVLRTAIREQALDAIAVPIGWITGTWAFEDGAAVAEDIPLGLGVQDALMEAARRLGHTEVVQQHMGSPDTVVDFTATGAESRLSLRPDEWAMLTHIDGHRTVGEIAERAGCTPVEANRTLFGLLAAGVLVRVDPAGAPAIPAPTPPPPATGDAGYLDDLLSGGALPPAPATPPMGTSRIPPGRQA